MGAPCPHRTHIIFIFEARRALWAPRSVGPYGVGRAPTPLMHAPTGGMHMGAHRAPIIGRDFFFFFVVARPLAFGSFPAPVMHPYGVHMGALKGTHYKRACEQGNPSG
jgi:hypothetical protein